MDLPAQRDDEDLRKLALAPDGGMTFLHHDDGTWSFVDDDGWPVDPEELHAEVTSTIAAVSMPVIDIEPISVQNNEIR
ncbi:hypothetical protein [Nocardia sp. NPDC050710]|uniref:hypothetical protein n=1 Tax=Nocardia sp. NPDC050710 TaxID=3157220 RepID=UPI0033C40812